MSWKRFTIKPLANISLGCACLLSGCSLSNHFSSQSGTGALIGSGLGVATGAIVAEQDPSIDRGPAMQTFGIAAGLIGQGIGAYANQEQVEREKATYRVRTPYQPDAVQEEIDTTAEYIYDSTSWGAGEVNPWQDRYQTDTPSTPYQGPY